MTSLIASIAGGFIAFLTEHSWLAYPVLFFGSFFETFIISSFFIYGEFFFLAGSILAGTHVLSIWLVAPALIGGGIAGDTCSFIFGKHYGMTLFKENRRLFNPKNYDRGKIFFDLFGDKAVFLARFMGPVSWITPFLAGVYTMHYRTFLKYNTPSAILGIGQFILLGYFLGANASGVLDLMCTNGTVVIECIVGITAISTVIYVILKWAAPETWARCITRIRQIQAFVVKHFLAHSGFYLIVITLSYFAILGILIWYIH